MTDAPRPPGLIARGPWRPQDVEVSWRREPFGLDPEASAQADAVLAGLRARGSPTHDGLAARLADVGATGARLTLELEPVRWSLRLLGDALDSLSALCVVRDAEGRWLAGRRAGWVATWAGRWALGAGGSVEVGENPADTLARELTEEWSVTPERLTVEALVRVPSGLVLVVGLAALAPGAEVTIDPEHDAYAWWPPDPDDWPPEAEEPLRWTAALLGR